MYFSGLFTFALYHYYPQLRRISTFVGLLIIVAAITASSFATTVPHLIITQGILYGIGGSLLYFPAILFIEEWFVRRKGLAFGIMWAGTGMAGVLIPIIMSAALQRYSQPSVIRAWAIFVVVLASPLLYFVKARLPISSHHRARPFDLTFLLSPVFWIFQAGNILEGLGYFIPGIYLPTFAEKLGMSTTTGSLMIALVNGASVAGTVLVGHLNDKLPVTTVILILTLGATFAVFVTWGLGLSAPVLATFSLLYGLFAGGYTTCWPGMIGEVQAKSRGADSGMLFGFLAAGRGIGAVVSGPLSERLLNAGAWEGAGFAYGTAFGSLITFTGTSAALGGLGWCAKRFGWF